MKSYPTIPVYDGSVMKDAYVFLKYDGSNLRFEWNIKRGWYKFGTRNRLFDENDKTFGSAIKLFKEKYCAPQFQDNVDFLGYKQGKYPDGSEISIERYLKDVYNAKRCIVFAEYFGKNSFAGQHNPSDKKDIKIIDLVVDNKGFMDPTEFIKFPLDRSPCVRHHDLTPEFAEQVKTDYFSSFECDFGTKIFEGVVCKGGSRHDRWMCKIKTQQWLDEVKKMPNWQTLI